MKTTSKLLVTLGIAGLAGLFNATGQAADAFQTKINPKDGAEMVFVPAGPFKMGIDPIPMDIEKREQFNTPKHEVTLDGYWIYKYPVTVKQYKKFIAETQGAKPAPGTTGKMPDEPLWGWKDDHPMVMVTWADAVAYAKWAGAALPTEAQWEKAARGTDERLYPWGNEWNPKLCVHSDKVWGDHKSTEPVGSHPGNVSPYGAMDMAGNIWEWCNDWWKNDYYKESPANNPTGPLKQTWTIPANSYAGVDYKEHINYGFFRVARGGAWTLCKPKCFQSVNRDWGIAPGLFTMDLGFRCVVNGK